MYLTKEEYLIAKEMLNGTLGFVALNKAIGHKLSKKIVTNDPRIDSLYQKYNVDSTSDFLQTADINKVEVRDISSIPYFEYDKNMQLVKKIPLRKKDVNMLVKFFENIEDEDKEFQLAYAQNGGYLYRYMQIDDKYIFEEVDGID